MLIHAYLTPFVSIRILSGHGISSTWYKTRPARKEITLRLDDMVAIARDLSVILNVSECKGDSGGVQGTALAEGDPKVRYIEVEVHRITGYRT